MGRGEKGGVERRGRRLADGADTRRKAGPFRSRTAGIAAPRSFRRAFVRHVRSTRPARSCLLRSEEADVYRRTRAALGDPASPREERSRQTDTRDEVVGERGGGTERPGCRSGRGRSGGRTWPASRPESAVQSEGRGRARGLSGGQGHGDELMDGMRTLKHGEAT